MLNFIFTYILRFYIKWKIGQIILSLKQIRLKKQVEEFDSETVKVSISNQDNITAGDIGRCISGFQVLNPNAYTHWHGHGKLLVPYPEVDHQDHFAPADPLWSLIPGGLPPLHIQAA